MVNSILKRLFKNSSVLFGGGTIAGLMGIARSAVNLLLMLKATIPGKSNINGFTEGK